MVKNTKKDKEELQKQAAEILARAEEKGISEQYFFKTTFERYRTQLDILERLESAIYEHGATITKEYVKGRENLCMNPAISEYNKTATAANGTVSTLVKIVSSFENEDGKRPGDELLEFLRNN